MARTILAIAIEAAERLNTAPAPSTLFNTNVKVAKLLRVAAHDTIREYLRRTGSSGLSEFQSTWVFALKAGQFAYPLPPDYHRMVPNTEYSGGHQAFLLGPATPKTWAAWIFGGAATPVDMGWRIRNNAIWFARTPATSELIAIEYISNFPVVSTLVTGDYDMSAVPPRVTAPFVPRDGHIDLSLLDTMDLVPDVEDQGAYEADPGFDASVFGPEIFDTLRRISVLSARAPLPEVRRPEFTQDTDKPALADDYVLSLGMTFRLRRGLGLDYAEAAAEYELELEQRLDHDAGGARDIRLGRCDSHEVLPLGNGNWTIS